MGRRPKQTFLQRRNAVGQKAHKKMFNIIDYANQNDSEVPPYTCQKGHHYKVYK